MDKKDILRLAKDPRFIPGIYNYCDRWCKRCTFTSRCLNYTINKENIEEMATCDLNNEVFWIYVKLLRALAQDAIEEGTSLQNDSDGSALVALIAIDRSIRAWGRLQEYFLQKTDTILDILLHLDRLRRMTEQVFPDARDFKRPGFDDMT